jgi:hypothetical protein
MSTLGKLPVSLLGKCGDLGIDLHSVIPLSEHDDAYWLKVTTSTSDVEGKLHIPKAEPTRLLVYMPGFPGGGATDFEANHLAKFLDAGYTVFTIRHNGSLLTGEHSDYYISCPPRQKKAKLDQQQYLGAPKTFDIGDWLLEPFIAIEALGEVFEEIVIAGHSFGGLALFYSMRELVRTRSKQLSKIKRVVSLAGATGRVRSEEEDPILVQWADYLETDWARERVAIGDTDNNIQKLKSAYHAIHDGQYKPPSSTQFVLVVPWGDTADSTDEYIDPNEALDLIVTLGRGTLIVDKTHRSDSDTGELAHDMSKFTTETFLKIADANWNPEKQILCIDHKGLH